jgi:hypothetical protein
MTTQQLTGVSCCLTSLICMIRDSELLMGFFAPASSDGLSVTDSEDFE